MGTTTKKDPRFAVIESSTVYGVYHEGMLVYVGETTNPLPRRLDLHRRDARDGKTSRLHRYIREHVESPRKDLDINELQFETEADALDAVGDTVLNTYKATGAEWEGYDWTSHELDVLEECSMNEATERLDASYTQIRTAAVKLGEYETRENTVVEWDRWDHLLGTMSDADLAEKVGCSTGNVTRRRNQLGIESFGRSDTGRALTEEEVVEIWTKYHAFDDLSYNDLADEYGVSTGVIGGIMRRDSYNDVDLPSETAIDAHKSYVEAGV